MGMKAPIKSLIRWLCDDFSYSRVFVADLTEMKAPNDERVSEVKIDDAKGAPSKQVATFAGDEAGAEILFGIWENGTLAGRVACFPGNTYQDAALPGGYGPNDVLVNRLVIAPNLRNRNLGSALLRSTFARLAENGYRRAYAVIWHNNGPSIRAFEKAGALLDHKVIMISLRLHSRPLYLRLPKTRHHTRGSGSV